MTIDQIKTANNTNIRSKTAVNSITRGEVADQMDALADEQLLRGIRIVADTTALSALSGADNKNVIVTDNGIYGYASSGTANGTTIFAASGGGVWVQKFGKSVLFVDALPASGKDSVLYVFDGSLYIWNGSSYDAVSSGGGGSQTLDDVLGVGNNSGTQMILGGTTADTWHANTGDPYPVLSLDKTNTDFNNYSPILNFKGAADGGIIWQFNPLALGIDEAAPYSLNYGIARDLQYEGINNASYTFGFNLNATGARLDVNNPSFGNTIETNYEISQHGWCLENYTSFTAIDGSTMRPMYSIFNRDSLYNSSTFWSSDKFQWQAGKSADVLGSMAFSVGKVDLAGAVLSLFPPTSGSVQTVLFDFYGTENYSNQIRMMRPTGATGAGTLDKAMGYAVSGTEPVLEVGADNIGTIGISNGMIALGPFGGTNAIYAHISTPTVHIGRFTAQHGRNSLSTMQINYNAQFFYETNTGIDEYDALRLNNTSGKKWSIGADNNGKFYLNNTTDALRAFEIPVEGGIIPTKLTATQMSALSSPQEGAVFYVTDTNGTFTAKGWWGYDGSAWQKLN